MRSIVWGAQSCTWNTAFVELVWQSSRAELANITASHSPFACAVTRTQHSNSRQSISLTHKHTQLAHMICFITPLLLFHLAPPACISLHLTLSSQTCFCVCELTLFWGHVWGTGVRTVPCGVWLTSTGIMPERVATTAKPSIYSACCGRSSRPQAFDNIWEENDEHDCCQPLVSPHFSPHLRLCQHTL